MSWIPEGRQKLCRTFEKWSLSWHIILYFAPWSVFQIRDFSVQSFFLICIGFGPDSVTIKVTNKTFIDFNGTRVCRRFSFGNYLAGCLRVLSRNVIRWHKNYINAYYHGCLFKTDALGLYVWKLKLLYVIYDSPHCWREEMLCEWQC